MVLITFNVKLNAIKLHTLISLSGTTQKMNLTGENLLQILTI